MGHSIKMKPKVIYIAGEGRSGSTLLERILGQHPKIFAAGELIYIWERSFIENQLCSCNKSFYDCEIWKGIILNFRKKVPNMNPSEIIDAFMSTSRIRHYFFKKDFNKTKYAQFINGIYTNLYTAILETVNREFIVDSSKQPVFAHILKENPNLELYILHIVRDPRAVAYSWQKKKVRPEIKNKVEYMPRYSPIRTAISWNVVNKISFDLSKESNVQYLLVRYEDLVSNPKEVLKKIYSFLNLEDNLESLFLDEKTILLSQNHTVAGNPMRFKTGEIKLSPDEKWKFSMNKWNQIFLKILCYRILKRLRYA